MPGREPGRIFDERLEPDKPPNRSGIWLVIRLEPINTHGGDLLDLGRPNRSKSTAPLAVPCFLLTFYASIVRNQAIGMNARDSQKRLFQLTPSTSVWWGMPYKTRPELDALINALAADMPRMDAQDGDKAFTEAWATQATDIQSKASLDNEDHVFHRLQAMEIDHARSRHGIFHRMRRKFRHWRYAASKRA